MPYLSLRRWSDARISPLLDYPATKKCITCGHFRQSNPSSNPTVTVSTPTCAPSSSTCSSVLIGNDEEQRMNAINKSMENINVERVTNKESKSARYSGEKRFVSNNKRPSSSAASDRLWLKACQTLLDHGSLTIVCEYFLCGGDPTRQITIEDTQLLSCSYLTSLDLVGRTLKNLANITGQLEQFCKFETAFQQLKRQQKKVPHQRRVPANICNRLNGIIQHFFQSHLKLKKVTEFQSYFLTEWFTAVLPAGRTKRTSIG